MTTGVSIVIPTWNGVALLKRFLPSVIETATRYGNDHNAQTEIIVVDDGSTDDTVDWLINEGFAEQKAAGNRQKTDIEKLPADLRFVRNKTNRGFGEACNRGVEAARFPLVYLLNNDVEPDPGSIAPLVENFAGPNVFAVHCRVFELEPARECGTGKIGSFRRGFIRVHRSYVAKPNAGLMKGKSHGGEMLYSIFAGGGSAMIDRKKFLEIGGFEPLLSPFYWEDVELSYRAWKRGYAVLYEPRAITRHRVSSTIGKLKRGKVRRIEQRNRLIYHWIHLHDGRMLVSHALWVLLLALTALLRFKPGFIPSVIAALKLLPKIRARRREEKQAAQRSDRDVFNTFALLERRGHVFVYDDYEELKQFNEKEKASPAED